MSAVTAFILRVASDQRVSELKALWKAMMALAAGPGYIGADGKTELAYAHPVV
jgi:hypothetical protein